MRTFLRGGLFALFGVLFGGLVAGCDSGGDDRADAEVIVGTWDVNKIEDSRGDQTSVFEQNGTMEVTFGQAGNFSIVFDAIDPTQSTTLVGPYRVNEEASRLTLDATYLGTVVPLELEYTIESDDAMTMRLDAALVALMNALLKTDFQGTLVLSLARS